MIKTLPVLILVLLTACNAPWPTQEALDAEARARANAINTQAAIEAADAAQARESSSRFDAALITILQFGGIGIAAGLIVAGIGLGVGVAGKAWLWSMSMFPNKRGQMPLIVHRNAGHVVIADPNRSLTGLTLIDGATLSTQIRAMIKSEVLPELKALQLGERDYAQLMIATQANHIAATIAAISNKPDQPLIKSVTNKITMQAPDNFQTPYTITDPNTVSSPALPPIKINDETGTHLLGG
jgi:hypothetical protein